MDKPIALITGASGGIGRAIALQLAMDGFCIVVHYHTQPDAAEATRDTIVQAGGQAVIRGFDITKREEIDAAVKDVSTDVGPIRILVNNAATIRDYPLMGMPDDAWHVVIDTNLNGLYYCTKAVVRRMAGSRRPGRRIINITSVVGEMGNIGQANYAAAKAGVIGFTKTVAREVAPMGITVNAVAPGFIATHATQHLQLAEVLKRIPLARIGDPQDVAHVVSFLVSEQAGYITGQVIRVNGGLLM